MTFSQLRQKHPVFIYESYDYQLTDDNLQIKFQFQIGEQIKFQPTLTINNINLERYSQIPQQLLDNWIFHLGLAEIPSYWKCTCSPRITIKAGALNQQQVAWWKELLIKGLGEFFYQNKIQLNQETLVTIKTTGKPLELLQNPLTYSHPFLIPVGGGKDSSLMLGILDKNKIKYDCLLLQPQSPAALQVCQQANPEKIITLDRQLDPKLLELNTQGYLNGHTPFSSYLSFVSVITAHLFGHQQILVANERSANQGNANYQGLEVNHQYSKSFAYEQAFLQYASQYLQTADKQAEYLSFLRPLYELQISQAFAQYPQFLSIFKSCNVGQKQNIWCHQCPKCLFVYAMLYPFVETKTLTQKIFQHDLFTDKKLSATALSLIGATDAKPFECVGTFAESQAAFYLSWKKFTEENPGEKLPIVLQEVKQNLLAEKTEKQLAQQAETILQSWNTEHNLEQKLVTLLKNELN